MRISVVLAVRNGERFLGELLDSVARQSRAPAELVVYDDASDDATPRILDDFAARVPFPVRVLREDDWRGHVHGFLTAAHACSGDAISLCDADDVWEERKIERSAAELERPDTTLAMHTTRVVDAELNDLGRCWPRIDESRRVAPLGLTGLDVHAPGMAMTFRRDLLGVADFDARPPSRYGHGRQMLHDEWILFMAGVLGHVSLIAEPLLLYRQHGANDSGGWVDAPRQLGLRPALEDYSNAAEHTAACAAYLGETRSDDPHVARRLAAGAAAYRAASERWAARRELYRLPDRRSRARVLRRLVGSGAYSGRAEGGFGRAALGKDLAAGLALRVR